jgi:hypothetical protein
MPRGPKGEKRPADVIGNAIRVAKIATGEIEEKAAPDDGKDKAAQALGNREKGSGKALESRRIAARIFLLHFPEKSSKIRKLGDFYGGIFVKAFKRIRPADAVRA